MNLEEIEKVLIDFSTRHNLKQKAKEMCLLCMTNALKDDPKTLGGFNLEEIRLNFVEHELIFDHSFYNTPFVKTQIGLYKTESNDIYVGGYERIGAYFLDTDINGEHFDDWLLVEEEKNNQLAIVGELENLGKMLPERYLRRNSVYYDYLTYVAQVTSLYQSRNLTACQLFVKRAFEFTLKTQIPDDFGVYMKASKKYIRRIANYMNDCDQIDEDMLLKFKSLGILYAEDS